MNITEEKNNQNSECKVLHISQLYGTDHFYATIRFSSPGMNRSKVETISIPEMRKKGTLELHIPEFLAMEDATVAQQPKLIQDKIQEALRHPPALKTMLPQGFNYFENRWVYVLGDQIINNGSGEKVCAYNPSKEAVYNQLTWSISEPDWLRWIETFCSEESRVALFMCALTPYVNPILKSLDFPEKVVHAYVCSESSTGKSTLCEILTNIYGNFSKSNSVNLGSDKDEILEKLTLYGRDRCFLVDDLNASNTREAEKRRDKLSWIIQMTSCSGSAPADLDSTALLITAEYLLQSMSSRNRCVLIRLNSPFEHAEQLEYLKANAHLYSCFLREFLLWVCKNHPRLCKTLSSMLCQDPELLSYRGGHDSVSDYVGYSRVMMSHKILRITGLLLGTFLCEKFPKKINHQKIQEQFFAAIEHATADTLKAIRRESLSEFMEQIIEIFVSDPDHVVARTAEKYFKKPSKKIFFRDGDEGNTLYFRNSSLRAYLKDCVPTKQTAKIELRKHGLLEQKNSGHLPDSIRYKHHSDQSYYRIEIPALVDFLKAKVAPGFCTWAKCPLVELNPYLKPSEKLSEKGDKDNENRTND